MRDTIAKIVNNPKFDRFILILIILNAVVLALDTVQSVVAVYGGVLGYLDDIMLAVFVAEILMRLFVDFKGFWRDPWRIFDFVIVGIALMPATGQLSILRAFRVLRVLRLVSGIPSMRRVVSGLLGALPGMGSVVMLLGIIYFVFAVLSTKLYAAAFPEWFGTLGASTYTLFQVMTLESWSMGIVRPVMEEFPGSWLLFVPFILMTAFTVLNLFIGVIVDAMQSEHEAEAQAEREHMEDQNAQILAELRALRSEIAEMKGKA